MRISDWSSDVCSSDLHDMIVGQVPVCKRCNAQFSALARLNRNVAAAIMFQSEAYVRPRHGEATDNISARRIFRPSGAEEFAADGHFSEKLLHTNACSRGSAAGPSSTTCPLSTIQIGRAHV